MICQIEITTYCNAQCFYCPNEYLPKHHMALEEFQTIVDNCPKGSTVLMQGTGEPLLHPRFWEMVVYVKSKNNLNVGIITNGTIPMNEMQLGQIDTLGISVDTLSAATAERSGRPDLIPIISSVLHYHSLVPGKVRIYAVDFGQDINPLQAFAKNHGIGLNIQRIQGKSVYQKRYQTPTLPYRYLRCRYIENEIHRFVFVNGKHAPCAYMVDSHSALSAEEISRHFKAGRVPPCCSQCGELVGIPRLSIKIEGKRRT
ncbi:radical SAM protein [Sulfuricurvum sp.]|uniref:radical SAM protein n=1 Tax=Sulfuricurvum sp. TaxID=2025608 RepID=UPI00262D49AE|nr:radical SAM protein [Sulfuricurvum sp.]MDD2838810.1 radical SAM protein [Sulfuricurvum sp.]MDD3597870.1 radical SAM protein [Sulfuricurvum sp.]MDD4883205.1 radical SAM protein [Sulfuricurvum sp.]